MSDLRIGPRRAWHYSRGPGYRRAVGGNGTGTLIIHAGPYAGLRRRGNTSDTDEDVKITQLGAGTMKVEMLGLEQVFTDVQQIYMSGGFGNDSLLLVDVNVPITAFGGDGTTFLSAPQNKITSTEERATTNSAAVAKRTQFMVAKETT